MHAMKIGSAAFVIRCDLIVSESKRDNCYTTFALDGDYSVCEKITNKYLKQSCIALSQS